MKHQISAIALTVAIFLTSATAAPRNQTWKIQRNLNTVEDFQELKVGDTVAQVCKLCDSVSIKEIESTEGAMTYCKQGTVINCPSCPNKATVTFRGPRSENRRAGIRYVDEHGQGCMFMTKLSDKPAQPTHTLHSTHHRPHWAHR